MITLDNVMNNSFLLVAILLIIGVLTTKFSSRIGLPSLVFYIIVGMVLSNFIYFDDVNLTQTFGILALVVILFEGGMQSDWSQIKKVIKPSVSMATFGVLITTIVIGVSAKFILDISWLEGLLFGAIVGSTDAAAVFAVIGNKNIKNKLASTLEAESGTNDPMAVFLTITLIALIQQPDANLWITLFSFVWQMGLGLVAGLLMGKITVWSINKINLDSSGLYPILSVGFALVTYSFTTILNGSGFLAVYIMALIVGNSELTYRHSIFRFNEGFAWMMQILMFILLGLLVFPSQLKDIIWQGLALSLLLMLVARPIGVFLSTINMGFDVKDKIFISSAGLKGAVPIVLATYPMIAGLENSQLLFNVVFFVVLTSALVQGASITPLANKLGLSGGEKITSPHTLELVSIGKSTSEIIEIQVDQDAAVINKALSEIKLPNETLITAVIRGDHVVTPSGNTRLQEKDIIYVLTTKVNRKKVTDMFTSEQTEPGTN
ncbi:potassium/proton antiporter [Aquibacillus koreensis]|uniref:Potassium/proton antiporter n=1 Tax=Aquibacillus koreensis TaxID=279446 RepID=A0A9X4AJ89_9BACI|nr:potassium/proton antiporter [Aquibacillus koreensis]MCT2535632.1 potassium/proton antiporter [Aquibacillus koreensis]MDC3420083.1 potassium/proton antiporter [Aquibacillus koreensis]